MALRKIVGILMGTNCAPFIADLFLFCYERDLMKDLSNDNQADIIKVVLPYLVNFGPFLTNFIHQIGEKTEKNF